MINIEAIMKLREKGNTYLLKIKIELLCQGRCENILKEANDRKLSLLQNITKCCYLVVLCQNVIEKTRQFLNLPLTPQTLQHIECSAASNIHHLQWNNNIDTLYFVSLSHL